MWILRDNYGNEASELENLALEPGSKITFDFRLLQFATKADAEAYVVLKIVEGVWYEGVWNAELEKRSS